MQHSNYNNNNNQHHHHHHHHSHRTTVLPSSLPTTTTDTTTITTAAFTNTAKLPIETVKSLIASVSRHPNLWIRTSNGQKRCDINALWQQVSQEVHLPVDICRIKWGHLRDNFRKVFIRNTLSGEPPTTWRFYNDMRFMEGAVAENVMRQHRLREQNLYWQELHQNEQKQKLNSTNFFDLHDNYERSMHPNQFVLGELPSYYNYGHEASHKRIKLEPKDSTDNFQQGNSPSMSLNGFPKTGSYDKPDHLEDDDDDDFDEDAASTEENYPNSGGGGGGVVNERVKPNDKTNIISNGNERKLINQIIKPETHTNLNTEAAPLSDAAEQDSDRMFLLSLLPYLRRVTEQRKLKVRQRLQNVLIEEFG